MARPASAAGGPKGRVRPSEQGRAATSIELAETPLFKDKNVLKTNS